MKVKYLIFLLLLSFNIINSNDLIFYEEQNNILDFDYLIKRHRENPKNYINTALEILKTRNGKVIVELGSMRFPLNHDINDNACAYCEDGHSSILMARSGCDFYSVDIDPNAFNISSESCKNYKNAKIILQDAIEFLKNFDKPIDLLYLDAWDAIEGTNYAEKHLEAYEIAKKNLHANSLILIDDTDVLDGGKGKLIIAKALSEGYKILFSGRQTLISK